MYGAERIARWPPRPRAWRSKAPTYDFRQRLAGGRHPLVLLVYSRCFNLKDCQTDYLYSESLQTQIWMRLPQNMMWLSLEQVKGAPHLAADAGY